MRTIVAALVLVGCAALEPSELYTEVGRVEYSDSADVFDSWEARIGLTWQFGPWQRQIGELAESAAASRRELERLADRAPMAAAPVVPVEVYVGEPDAEPEAGGETPVQLLVGGGAAFLMAAGAALRLWLRRRAGGAPEIEAAES
jgi:hypothetical protein